MTKMLLEDQRPIVWRHFKVAFYKKYFPNSVRRQKVGEFVRLEQRDITVAQYETKFTELTFCSTIDCYRGRKDIKVSRWIKVLSEEQNIYFEA